MLKATLDKEQLVIIARVVHEAVRAFQTALGQEAAPPWDEAEDWQIDATVEGIKFRLENPDAPASAQHDQWMAQKLADGWSFGTVKDGAKKIHPLLVPYSELPLEEKQKDALFGAIVTALKTQD